MYVWYYGCSLMIMYKHTEKWWVAWNLSSFEENYFEVFFLNSCKQKERDNTRTYVYTRRDTHWVFSTWRISSYIEIHTQSRCHTHPFTHTHTLTACEYKCCECPWEFTGVCILPNDDEIPDLYYSWEDTRREWQFWCTLEWHNHVNTCILKTSELTQSF